MSTALLAALRNAVGEQHVIDDPDVRASYETDWTRRWSGSAAAVVRPRTAQEVAAVLRACAEHGAAVIPQGGNTGLVGASVPRSSPTSRQVVLSTARLTTLAAIDRRTLHVAAESGVTLGTLQAAAHAAGLDAAVDFAARDSATLGGLVACDAGGIRAVRHGTVRTRVAGLEAVMANGSIVRWMSGLLKDNAGYDVPALLIGSEGTLGVITSIVWRLVPRRAVRALALVPVASISEAVALLAAIRPDLPSLEACEFMTDDGLALVVENLGVTSPVSRAPAYVLVECASNADALEELAEALAAASISDAAIADDTAGRERLWQLRERHTDAISAAGIPHKLDVGIPLDRLAAFCDAVRAVMPDGARAILFGHLGDGNVHVNLLGLDAADDSIDESVLRIVEQHGGTISAEHGVGVAKARWLHLTRSADEIAVMRAIKTALDPAGILNPGVLLQPHT